jgi:hypothetical protein
MLEENKEDDFESEIDIEGAISYLANDDSELEVLDSLDAMENNMINQYTDADAVTRMHEARAKSFVIRYGAPDIVNDMITLSIHNDFRDAQLAVISKMMSSIIVNEYESCRKSFNFKQKYYIEGISLSNYSIFKSYWNYAEQAVRSNVSNSGNGIDPMLKKVNAVFDSDGVLTKKAALKLLTGIATQSVEMAQVSNSGGIVKRKANVSEMMQAISSLDKLGAFEEKKEEGTQGPNIGFTDYQIV